MSCQLNDSQIQSWLDGDSDESQHLSECSACQQRLLSVQKLRSRLIPPPSPLGRDFARRTAQHVLRVSEVVKPQKPSGGWWSRLRDNPLVHVVQRERSRRLLRLPGLAAILLLYLLPGGFIHYYGETDANWAYFGMVQIGLTLLIPLFLLSLEWATLSSLVRGRCLEEMLQTGLQPALVSDTLALGGLRSLLPALLMIGLALLPVHPQSLLVWLPLTALAFSASGYLSQAQLLGMGWPRWLSFLGAAAVAGCLGAPAPWNLASAAVLSLLGLAARRQSVGSLTLQQQGRLPAPRRQRGSAWQTWLARRLPDLALLQRELRRRNLLTLGVLAGNLGVCLAVYIAFSTSAFAWPLLAGCAGLLAAFSLVQREKDGGAYEILLHSGLRPRDFWASAVWIAGLQFLPACLTAVLFTFYKTWNVSPLSAGLAALGTGLSLFVSLRAGAVIGASLAIASQSPRQASTRCVQEAAVLCLLSLLMVGLVAPLFGSGSPLSLLLQALRLNLSDALDGIAILPVMLALHLRARSLSGPSFLFNPWTYSLALLVPLCLWFQIASLQFYRYSNSQANSCTGLAILVGLAWAWWAAPLTQKPGKVRWSWLTLSYTATLLAGLPVTAWSLAFLGQWRAEMLPEGLSEVDPLQTVGIVAATAWLVYLLGIRLHWRSQGIGNPRGRSLWAGGLAALVVTCFAVGMLSLALVPRPHAAEFAAFVAKNSHTRLPSSSLQHLLRQAHITHEPYRGGHVKLVNPYELRGLRGHEQKFQELLAPLLADGRSGSQRDQLDASGVLFLQAEQALYQHQPAEYLDLLEKMSILCAHSEQHRTGSALYLTSLLRGQILLALRSQIWTLPQLEQIDRIQANLPDGPTQIRAACDRRAARHYQTLLRGGEYRYPTPSRDPIDRFFTRQQAEIFLEHYLSKFSASDSPVFRTTYWTDPNDSERQLLIACCRLVIDLEHWKLTHGRYPETWKEHPNGTRVFYQTLGNSYQLKVWMPRVERMPLVWSSQGPEWRMNSIHS
ncbi:MAG: hypothetical protein KF760_15405 [Candidatus Eremiobacteraeota bacterium]|nr:hypothetical protein [Candidatus Eremiobacteraeota bacterium]MCW5869507.1 hypothetical protein [Candidatus Eremiobacteraeota bacterium]